MRECLAEAASPGEPTKAPAAIEYTGAMRAGSVFRISLEKAMSPMPRAATRENSVIPRSGKVKRNGVALAMAAALAMPIAALVVLAIPQPASAEPAWYQRKKKVDEQKEEERVRKETEKAVVGEGENDGAAFQLSVDKSPPPETFLLFRDAGKTESLSLDLGHMNQPELPGITLAAQYGFGWWALPNLILDFSARISGTLGDTYVYVLGALGPQVHFVPNKHVIMSAFAGFGISQGLTRVQQASVPPPPSEQALAGRTGFVFNARLGYLFWKNREMGIGPAFSLSLGTQGERSFQSYSIGVTYQGGRPNYTGDVTGW